MSSQVRVLSSIPDASVVQWIERDATNVMMRVRFLLEVQKRGSIVQRIGLCSSKASISVRVAMESLNNADCSAVEARSCKPVGRVRLPDSALDDIAYECGGLHTKIWISGETFDSSIGNETARWWN